jgi:hypothetical protein
VRWVALAVLLASSHARADHDAAERAAADAATLAGKGDFAGAAHAFHTAYIAEPRPDLICNAGVAYQRANDLPRAHLFLTECVLHGTSMNAKFIEDVRANISALETTMRAGDYTPFDITVEPAAATIAIEGYQVDEAFVGARVVWLPFGPHRITVRAEGYAEQSIATPARDHTTVPIHVQLERPGKDVPPPPPPPKVPADSPRASLPVIMAGGATGAAIVLGTVAFALGHHDADQAHFALTQKAFKEDSDRANTWNVVLGASSIVAIAGAAATTYLFLRYQKSTHVEAFATPTGGELFLTGSF